jgi:uncharacterized protein (UPF0332 family)
MSPRSAEFYEAARRRLAGARKALDDDPGGALSLAYYAMLYAARAALSERDTYAKTHSGTWNLFHERFVEGGSFDSELLTNARKVQPKREDADYEAWAAPREEAERVIELAATFLAAVEALLRGTDER